VQVAGVQEPGFFVADVDERRLNAGQDRVDPAQIHVAHQASCLFAFDHELDQVAVFDDGDPDFE
jgi:hypothetical protein